MSDPARADIIGILGGMGPAATADFYAKLVRATPAGTDQEHLRTLIWSDPTIPDRTAALLEDGPDPVPSLVAGARRLQAAGAAFIAVPCNTAHAFLTSIENQVDVPFLNMIEETCRRVIEHVGRSGTVGVLATTATVRSGMYRDALEPTGVAVLAPDHIGQERVMHGISRVKAGSIDRDARAAVARSAMDLIDRGAHAVIAGCSELPIALDRERLPVPIIDATQILAEAAVERARTRVPA